MKKFIVLLFALPFLVFSYEIPSLPHAQVSIHVIDCENGKIIIDHQSDLSLLPASCMKVITTFAALNILGPEFKFSTLLEYDGYIDEGHNLLGNIYIHGGGDPCLGSTRKSTWKDPLELWVAAIQKKGILSIHGRVIGDASEWEKALCPSSWQYEDLVNYYGAGACALSYRENAYDLTFKPSQKEGDPTEVLSVIPTLSYLKLHNEVLTGSKNSGDQATIFGSEYSQNQFVRGTIPLGVNAFTIKGSIPNPPETLADLLTKKLTSQNIKVFGKQLDEVSRKLLLKIDSPSVREIVELTNQNSINLYAEHLLKAMGKKVYQEGSTKQGIAAVKQFLIDQGVNLTGFNMADGSGLSRKNLVTAKQLTQILRSAYKSPYFELFKRSLVQKEEVFFKSGTMAFTKALTGFKKQYAFAIMMNNCTDYKLMHRTLENFLSYIQSID